jgi:hypothetical protein
VAAGAIEDYSHIVVTAGPVKKLSSLGRIITATDHGSSFNFPNLVLLCSAGQPRSPGSGP